MQKIMTFIQIYIDTVYSNINIKNKIRFIEHGCEVSCEIVRYIPILADLLFS